MSSNSLVEVDVKSTLDSVIKYLDDFQSDQLPFAIAGALIACGLDAKDEMTKKLFDTFTIRTGKFGGKTPWAARSLYVNPQKAKDIRAEMKSSGKASIEVASRSKVLGPALADGGVRKKRDGSDFAVPILGGGRKNKMTIVAPDRIGKTGKLRKGNDAGATRDRKKGFMLPLKNGKGQLLLTRNKPWKDGGRTRDALQAMFYLKSRVNVKPWWKPRDILLAAMEAKLPEHFVRKFNEAMRTRKPQ